MSIYWINLLGAGVLAIGMTTSARFLQGPDIFWPYLVFFNLLLVSWMLLERASIGIPWGTTFAVWAGIGAVGTIIVEMLFFGGVASPWQLLFLAIMAAGVIGYTVTSSI